MTQVWVGGRRFYCSGLKASYFLHLPQPRSSMAKPRSSMAKPRICGYWLFLRVFCGYISK